VRFYLAANGVKLRKVNLRVIDAAPT
jgi:hypothetical protein